MLDFLTRRAKWIIATFAIAVFALTQSGIEDGNQGWFSQWEFWQKIEGSTINQRYRLRGIKPPHPDIAMIGIQASSFSLSAFGEDEIAATPALQLMQQPYPWDRRVYAILLERLIGAGARVVMFDLVFGGSKDGDEVFAEALRKYESKVVIGSLFTIARKANDDQSDAKDIQYIPPNETLHPDPAQPIVGFVNATPDADGVTRRLKTQTTLLEELGSDFPTDEEPVLLSLATVAAQKFRGKIDLPPKEQSNFIDYAGPEHTYRVFSLEDCLFDRLWNAPPIKGGEVFKDKIVIIGPYAEIFQDVHQGPWGTIAGPELQASMLATLLSKSALREPNSDHVKAIALCMVLLAALICIYMRNGLIQGLLLLIVAGGFWFVCQQYFSTQSLVIPMVPPLFGLAVTGMGGIGFRYVVEQLERKRVRSVLDKYVSKNVARTILNDRRTFVDKLRGQKQPVTVLFSDIRGFTSMTEGTDATQLVTQLNEYFLQMVGIVHKHEGTLQKFIGDAIMAAWGDTHSHGLEVDARRAIQTALDMRAALAELNKGWDGKNDRMKLAIGIGVNHGEVVVGNIGHPDFRMEFTVLGDGVNLAARLESATKQFKTDILIGEDAQKLTKDNFIFRSVGAIAFKGKTKPVQVYFVLGDKSQPAPAWLEEYHSALSLYKQRCFDQAKAAFKAVNDKRGGEDYLCKMYIGKCEEAQNSVLSDTWDGSFALTEK